MSGQTPIEWTDATWNPVGGCSIKSPGCAPCYAQQLAGTRLKSHPLYRGTTTLQKGRPIFNGTMTAAPDGDIVWTWPLRWRGAKQPVMGAGQPSLIFAGDMSDVTHEDRLPWMFRRMLAIAALSPHIVQFLTKRPDVLLRHVEDIVGSPLSARSYCCPVWHTLLNRIEQQWRQGYGRYDEAVRPILMRAAEARGAIDCPALPNVWLGFSAERQREFDERWPYMRRLAQVGWTIFLSYEPAIGPLTLPADFLALAPRAQVIAGGMSGRGDDVSPSHPDWFRAVRDQCAAAGMPFFFKQWGEHLPWSQFNDADVVDDEEQTRFLTHEWEKGAWRDVGRPMWCDSTDGNIDADHCVARVGKKRTGRKLDGVEHSAFPSIAEAV